MNSITHISASMVNFKSVLLLLIAFSLGFSTSPAQTRSGQMPIIPDSVKVFQDNNYIGRGNVDEPVLHIVIPVSEGSRPVLSEVHLNFKGTSHLKDITQCRIYNTGNVNAFHPGKSSGDLLATARIRRSELTLKTRGGLLPGDNHLWLTVDVSPKAGEGNKIDVALESIRVDDRNYPIVNGNPEGSREILLKRVLVLAPGDYGSKNYRIPAIITADDHSLVIVTDKRKDNSIDLPEDIDIIAQRSTDGGKTWSEPVTVAKGEGRYKGYGDACITRTLSGKLVALYVGGPGLWNSTSEKPQGHYVSVSDDNGKSWTGPIDITGQLYGINCPDSVRRHWQSSFFGSGRGLTLRDGRIMAVIAVRESKENHKLNNYVVYSDDEGTTWHVSQKAIDGGDEAKVVELNDGTILLSSRTAGNRLWAKSTDRGVTWGPKNTWHEIWGNACDADIIRYTSTRDGYDKDRILHTLPNAKNRTNVSMWLSYDEGTTWPVRKTICKGESAYSSITILPDGTIGVYVEEDESVPYKMYFLNFSLDWLTDGKDHFRKAGG